VLEGSVTDGSGLESLDMSVLIRDPSDNQSTQDVVRTGGSWSYTLKATQPGIYTLWVLATDAGSNQVQVGPFAVELLDYEDMVTYAIYLPVVMKDYVYTDTIYTQPTPPPPTNEGPDLVGTVDLSPGTVALSETDHVTVSVLVINQGNAATTGPFWVDLYIEPVIPPENPNLSHLTLCSLAPCQRIAWEVDVILQPGEYITLTSISDSYVVTETLWSGSLVSGMTSLYAYIDSRGTAEGAVVEGNEYNNTAALTGLVVSGTLGQPGGDGNWPGDPIDPETPDLVIEDPILSAWAAGLGVTVYSLPRPR